MTIDRRRHAGGSNLPLTALEWRLATVSALGGVYLAAWMALSSTGDGRREAPADGAVVGERVLRTPRAVWIEDIPIGSRPAFEVPAGYSVVSSRSPVVAEPVVATRTVARRPIRVRTRSS